MLQASTSALTTAKAEAEAAQATVAQLRQELANAEQAAMPEGGLDAEAADRLHQSIAALERRVQALKKERDEVCRKQLHMKRCLL